ncbi:hypothetical protein PIB30_038523 [Stylosanthes scabra]|uniref:Aminotransferase-like plant mobile domain-containing protein n=1 Tax=Stylosanthes scabra TaxID=79078 RepID=A0ABU6UFS5_9FABA|nr:hypothetical protein [Stylosanthes scabra]
MAKKKFCQNVRVPRVLFVAERELYGWVDEEIFTQPSVVEADMLPELRHEMRLTVDRVTEGDFVLEAAGYSDQLPFQAQEDRTDFLWVYTELFIRLGVRLPFTDFQREVLSRCRVAASQLHLNGWGFLRTFERVCLHFRFRPSWHVFFYTYQLHGPPLGKGFMSFCAYQESIQEFKWHYFKVLPFPGKRPFWLDDEGTPFPWVYWNAEVGDFHITALDPLETLAFEFFQSLPAGLGKKSNFKYSLLKDMEKQSRFDRLMQKMKEAERVGPPSILPSSRAQTVASDASASDPAGGKPTNATTAKPFSVEREEGAREDPAVDLRQKRRKRKVSEASAEEAALGVNPIDHAFPPDYNFRAALDVGLTNGPIREILGPLVPEQLLGTAQFLACQLTTCLQVGVENTFAAKVQLEKELVTAKDQVDVLTAGRDSALVAPLLHAKIKSLSEELGRAEGERLSAFDRMKEVEERAKEQAAELESCRSALAQERKKVESLSQSLKGK